MGYSAVRGRGVRGSRRTRRVTSDRTIAQYSCHSREPGGGDDDFVRPILGEGEI